MADPVAVSALDGHLVAGRYGRAAGAPGVTLEETPVTAMAQLAGVAHGVALRDALSALALDAVPGRLRCSQGASARLLWTGPGQYLAVSRLQREDDLAGSLVTFLATAVADLGGTAVDLSHARTVLRLTGADCVEVLAKGCPLDLDAMQPGDCTPTLLGHFNVLQHRESEQAFEIYVTRSFAVACFEWLHRAAAEFGLQVR